MARLARVIVSLIIGAAAFGATLTTGQAQIADTVIVDLEPVAGAAVSGSAILTAGGDGTFVDLGLRGLAVGATYTATLHAGTCDAPSASFSALPSPTGDANGTATVSGDVLFHGTDPVAFMSIADNEHVIAIADATGVVACGMVPSPVAYGGTAGPGVPAVGPTVAVPLEAIDGGTVAGTATLSASGDGTQVELALTGLAAGAAYAASMHAGTCAQPSASFAGLPALTADATGAAAASGAVLFRGVEPVASETMTDGEHVIVIAGDAGAVACDVIPSFSIGPAATGNAGLVGTRAVVPIALAALGLGAAFAVAAGARRLTARRSR